MRIEECSPFPIPHSPVRLVETVPPDKLLENLKSFLQAFSMKNMERLKEYSVSIIGLNVEGISTENIDNVRQALIILLKNNPQIFEQKKSPEEVLQALNFHFPKTKQTETGRWAQIAKRLSEEHPITPEIDAVLQKGIEEFRAGFSLGEININQAEK